MLSTISFSITSLAFSRCFFALALFGCFCFQASLAFAPTTRSPLLFVPSRVASGKNQARPFPVTMPMSRDERDDRDDSTSSTNTLSRNQALQRMLQQNGIVEDEDEESKKLQRREIFNTVVNISLVAAIAAWGWSLSSLFMTSIYTPAGFQRLPTTHYNDYNI
jgi:hypothetical protein